jgi:predicted ATPase/DNA-binding CsgD family transcriptional regulator
MRSLDRTDGVPAEITEFVGRVQLVREVRAIIATSRLVTLVGVGGVGKTRLALRLAHEVRRAFSGSLAWAELADLPVSSRAVLVEQSVAAAFGLTDYSGERPRDAIVAHLRDRHCLLVMDNCEHLVGEVGSLIYKLLRSCPGLHVLATSRESLGIVGEHVVQVPPLIVPGVDDLLEGPGSEALELLQMRAGAVGAPLALDDLSAAAELCRRLEGLPLAIELAAGRLSALSVGSVLERLDNRFQLLTGGSPHEQATHQSFQQVLDWSYQLCSEPERLLWERVSVFIGGFDLRAVEVVCSGDGIERHEVLDLISGLVRRSLLAVDRRSHRNQSRYRILETLRQYGLQALVDRGDDAAFRQRHLDYYRRMTATAALDWYSPRELDWLSWAQVDLPNLRSAINHSFAKSDLVAFAEIAINLMKLRTWFFVGWLGEGRAWLERTLELSLEPSDPLRTTAVVLAGVLSLCQGDAQAGSAFLTEAHTLTADQPDFSPACGFLDGLHALYVESDPRSIEILKRVIDTLRRSGAPETDVVMIELNWAIAVGFCGDGEAALAASHEHLDHAMAAGAEREISWAHWSVGLAHIRRGDYEQALTRSREAVQRQRDIGDRWGIVWSTHSVAWALGTQLNSDSQMTGPDKIKLAEQIARVLGGTGRLREQFGVRLEGLAPFNTATVVAESAARRIINEEAYVRAFTQGSFHQYDDSQAFQHIFATTLGRSVPEPEDDVRRTQSEPNSDRLTARENEVAELVAQGLKNREIARRLVVSDRTVQTHVGNILSKQGLRNRQEIAVWFIRANPDAERRFD